MIKHVDLQSAEIMRATCFTSVLAIKDQGTRISGYNARLSWGCTSGPGLFFFFFFDTRTDMWKILVEVYVCYVLHSSTGLFYYIYYQYCNKHVQTIWVRQKKKTIEVLRPNPSNEILWGTRQTRRIIKLTRFLSKIDAFMYLRNKVRTKVPVTCEPWLSKLTFWGLCRRLLPVTFFFVNLCFFLTPIKYVQVG